MSHTGKKSSILWVILKKRFTSFSHIFQKGSILEGHILKKEGSSLRVMYKRFFFESCEKEGDNSLSHIEKMRRSNQQNTHTRVLQRWSRANFSVRPWAEQQGYTSSLRNYTQAENKRRRGQLTQEAQQSQEEGTETETARDKEWGLKKVHISAKKSTILWNILKKGSILWVIRKFQFFESYLEKRFNSLSDLKVSILWVIIEKDQFCESYSRKRVQFFESSFFFEKFNSLSHFLLWGRRRRRRRRYSPCSRRCAGFAWRSGCRAQCAARSAGEGR